MAISKTPALNLKAALQETGVAADTLRAWERRYGLPMPQRTAGGHRLYSQYDVETIKWLLAKQADGLSISRAVDSWNEIVASGLDPLSGSISSASSSAQAPFTGDANLVSLRAQWVSACMKFSETSAELVLNQAFSIFPVEAVCIEILQKGMVEIGRLWYENEVSVQQEHFASALAMRRLDALLGATPAPSRDQTILVGCPPNEWHTFTPLLLSLFLRRRGLNVIYLGANVPADRFEETIAQTRADLVVLVSQALISAATLQNTAFALFGLKTHVGFGGRIFNLHPNMAQYIPGNYLGDTIDAALVEIEKLLKTRNKKTAARSASQEPIAALQAFTAKRTLIEATVKSMIPPISIRSDSLDSGIQFLGNNIAAALQLGGMEYVNAEMDWIKSLLQAHQRPAQELADFMNIYSKAVDKHINGQGDPIKTWLKEQAAAL